MHYANKQPLVEHFYRNKILYSYFEKGCRKKKNIKVYATRLKGGLGIHWNFAYWPKGNLQVCVFARGKFVYPLRRPIFVALLLLLHACLCVRKILLKFRGDKCTLFLHV